MPPASHYAPNALGKLQIVCLGDEEFSSTPVTHVGRRNARRRRKPVGRDGWEPGGGRWPRRDHLKKEQPLTGVATLGHVDVADVYG